MTVFSVLIAVGIIPHPSDTISAKQEITTRKLYEDCKLDAALLAAQHREDAAVHAAEQREFAVLHATKLDALMLQQREDAAVHAAKHDAMMLQQREFMKDIKGSRGWFW